MAPGNSGLAFRFLLPVAVAALLAAGLACARANGKSAGNPAPAISNAPPVKPTATALAQDSQPAPAQAAGGQGASAAQPTPMAKPATAVPPPSTAQESTPNPATMALPAPLVAERGYSLLSQSPPILPEDAAIGPLQDWRAANAETQAALAAATAFLDGLLAGSPPDGAVLPARKAIVGELAAPFLASPRAVAYRVGRLMMAGEEGERSALAALRLAWPSDSPGGSPEFSRSGEIALRIEGGTWYVESIRLEKAEIRR